MELNRWIVSNTFAKNSSATKFSNQITDKSFLVGQDVSVVSVRLSKPALASGHIDIYSDLSVGQVLGTAVQPLLATFSVTKGGIVGVVKKTSQKLSRENPRSAEFVLVSCITVFKTFTRFL